MTQKLCILLEAVTPARFETPDIYYINVQLNAILTRDAMQ